MPLPLALSSCYLGFYLTYPYGLHHLHSSLYLLPSPLAAPQLNSLHLCPLTCAVATHINCIGRTRFKESCYHATKGSLQRLGIQRERRKIRQKNEMKEFRRWIQTLPVVANFNMNTLTLNTFQTNKYFSQRLIFSSQTVCISQRLNSSSQTVCRPQSVVWIQPKSCLVSITSSSNAITLCLYCDFKSILPFYSVIINKNFPRVLS